MSNLKNKQSLLTSKFKKQPTKHPNKQRWNNNYLQFINKLILKN